jgi:GntR family transcriptional repressor for pyruvate dehydrogenase complex
LAKTESSDASASRSDGFQKLHRSRASDQIAGALQSAIAQRRYRSGDRLPSEHELAAQFETSRGTVREALRVLEVMGFVQIRTGAGAFVSGSPFSSHALNDRLRWLVDRRDIVLEILEVREGLQAMAAVGCAGRATPDDKDQLRGAVEQGRTAVADGNPDAFAEADAAFHFLIGERCGNRMLADVVRYVEEIYRTSNRALVDLRGRSETSQLEHERVVECIAEGDRTGAELAMREHIGSVRHTLAALEAEEAGE